MEQQEEFDSLSFKVDAGLIDRLGRELVGKSETAVSELIKNAYDADAITVDVKFINTNLPGGTLRIIDTGLGMTREQLANGFMTISSTDKVHNPKSERFKRSKAGRKGIGRFATQRLGRQLIIFTQTKESTVGLKLTINWDDYEIDTDLLSIKNKVEEVEKTDEEGTELIINNLRESWSETEIKRIYRYVSDLLQPNYLSERSKKLKLAKQKDKSFRVNFFEEIYGHERLVADPDKMIFDKALATIEGWVDEKHYGFSKVESSNLELEGDEIAIMRDKKYKVVEILDGVEVEKDKIENRFLFLKNVRFKAYYFIYQREEYYAVIQKMDLKNIETLSKEQAGIKVYRNGFRVLPYGESNNDWLNLDRVSNFRTGVQNIPFANKNLFGFVELITEKEEENLESFEETASREGLLENESYIELQNFIFKALKAAETRLRFGVEKVKKQLKEVIVETNQVPPTNKDKSPLDKLNELEDTINNLVEGKGDEEQRVAYKNDVKQFVSDLKNDFQKLLDELGMTRVLAGLGLTIGEFTHEVVQFSPSINGDLSVLQQQNLTVEGLHSLENLKKTIRLFTSYTSYFNATVSANVSRELKPQDLDIVIPRFKEIVESDLTKLNIDFEYKPYGYELTTIPMHSSEWSSILFNLYTNSKKAIKRKDIKGSIKLIAGKENGFVYLEFLDNGDGIPENNKTRIFDAFFTTSTPAGFEATSDERLTGTGLGLKIVRDIVTTYGGNIKLITPESEFSTCFRIEIPLVTEKQKEEYGL